MKPAAAAIYARISSDPDDTRLGVERQLQDCRELAEREGWTVAEEYIDNDISAYSGKRRPAYERMLTDLGDGFRDGLIVYHQDRLTRRPIELEQFLDVVNRASVKHVRFVAGAGELDLANGDGLMVLRMLAAVAAQESATKSRRVARRMQQRAEQGLPNGGTRPFGFNDDRITHRPTEADTLRNLAARYLAGESLYSLTTWLHTEGVASVTGRPWLSGTLREVLASPRIAGLREHRGEVIGPAMWEPIITVEDHHRIVALMAQRRQTGRRTPRRYLLTGMLRCGRCGATLYSAARKTSRRYVCLPGSRPRRMQPVDDRGRTARAARHRRRAVSPRHARAGCRPRRPSRPGRPDPTAR